MNNTKKITVAFTGHRSYDGSADEELYALLQRLYERGCRRFLSGMAWGFDLAAAVAVVRLKREKGDVELVAVEPYAGFRRLFSGEVAVLYDRVKALADEVVVVSGERGSVAYMQRNDYLVDHADILVAWWCGRSRGGTAYTAKRAIAFGVELYNLYPQQGVLF